MLFRFIHTTLGLAFLVSVRTHAWFYKTPMPPKFTWRFQLYHYLLHSLLTPHLLLTLADYLLRHFCYWSNSPSFATCEHVESGPRDCRFPPALGASAPTAVCLSDYDMVSYFLTKYLKLTCTVDLESLPCTSIEALGLYAFASYQPTRTQPVGLS